MEETITAIATPLAPGGIGVLRISGAEAFSVAQKVFAAKSGLPLNTMKGYTAALGDVFDRKGVIDEGVATVFREPKSYTGENVVELSCHGGVTLLRRALQAILDAGARMAEPGEFTKRAFLNGKMDLTRAEAVMDLISAKSEKAEQVAASRQKGALYREMQSIKKDLFSLSADLTAFLDYSEETGEEIEDKAEEKMTGDMIRKLDSIIQRLNRHIDAYGRGQIYRQGVSAVLAGKPNSGKSTLMNLLSGTDRSIVTDLPGTTRDLIDESIEIDGILLNLTDTAGLRNAEGVVEKIGVERSVEKIRNAEFVLLVFDGSRPLEPEDDYILKISSSKRRVAVINKADLPQKLEKERISTECESVVEMAAKKGLGLEKLVMAIKKELGDSGEAPGGEVIANSRQLNCVKRAKKDLVQAKEDLAAGVTPDVVSVLLETASDALCEITGEKASEQIIEEIFSRFCIGK